MCTVFIRLTGKVHELVEVLDGEDWFAELAQVELEHAAHGVDVAGIGHVRQWVLAPLKRLAEVVDLHLQILLT